MMKEIRGKILGDTFLSYYHLKKDLYQQADREFPTVSQASTRRKRKAKLPLVSHVVDVLV